jgi:hypothetical protein
MKSILQTIKYGCESIKNFENSKKILRQVSDDPQITEYISNKKNRLTILGMDLIGSMIYDMCVENREPTQRKIVGKNTALSTLAINMVDDIIDNEKSSLDEKFTIIDDFGLTLLGEKCVSSKKIEERATHAIANKVYSDFLSKYDNGEYYRNAIGLAELVKHQFHENDKQRLLSIEKQVGGKSMDNSTIMTEMVRNQEFPEIRASLIKMGEYSQMIDDIHDLNEDIENATNTYATVTIREEGDTPEVRKGINDFLLSEANICYEKGLEALEEEKNKNIYSALKNFIDFKYKFF